MSSFDDDPVGFLLKNGYTNIANRNGVWVANLPLLFTWSICVGLYSLGWEKRFCYPSKVEAEGALRDWLTSDEPEPTGWIARR